MRAWLFSLFTFLFFTHWADARVQLGIDVLQAQDFAPLKGRRVGLVTNQTGVNGAGVKTRLVLKKHVNLVALYAPEHGIDGTILAGKYVPSRTDRLTGLTVHSLYAKSRKPSPEMLRGIDVLVYDMQDIGVRSYTYISTMVKCMEACGEMGIPFMVLDRPNPLGGNRVEGPGIEERWRSFVGQVPVPYVHGMTAGEIAKMTNAKGWAGARCNLTVIPMSGWSRDMLWGATGLSWVKTSPNIPRSSSVAYYAATGIYGSLSGSGFDVGIGGPEPFEIAGMSGADAQAFTARVRRGGIAANPYTKNGFGGARLALSAADNLNLTGVNVHLLSAAQAARSGSIFARYKDENAIFWKIYGSTSIRAQIEKGVSPAEIIAGWAPGVQRFRSEREPFLLYR